MLIQRRNITVVVAALLLAIGSLARASELSEDLRARRARAMERLGPDTMLILWSAPPQRYSLDIDYEYRQDSNLYYLTGIVQAGTTLVLMPGNLTHREVLFIKERNPEQEHWRGRLLDVDDARERSGIDLVVPAGRFDEFLGAMLGRQGFGAITPQDAAAFFSALGARRAHLALALQPRAGGSVSPAQAVDFAQTWQDRFSGFDITSATPVLEALRTVKTPYERKVLVQSLDISSEAQRAGMLEARSGAYEYEVKAAIEAVHRRRGAVSWSYPSIVGSGPNATILHYPDGDRRMRSGDLLLVDAACNYGYMSGDITRTYPVDGVFTQPQKDLYDIVLRAQESGILAARPGRSLQEIHSKTVEVVKDGLLKLGLITDIGGDQYRIWYTHSATHYIGIDVHDVGDRSRPLEAGMAFTIEPGIYIRQSALDTLPKTPENLAFIDKVQPAVRKYADLGVRVEDSFLLEAAGLRNLSASVPRTIQDIEAFLRTRAPGPGAGR